jgi:hypothetical protein
MAREMAELPASGSETPPKVMLKSNITPVAKIPARKPARNPVLKRCLFEGGVVPIRKPLIRVDDTVNKRVASYNLVKFCMLYATYV